MTQQPLLIALVAVQFLVHALGWAMAARLSRRARGPEGHFAVFWLALSLGLMLYVPAWTSGSGPRNVGDVLIVGALALQHRGMAIYWAQRPSDTGYAAVLASLMLALAISLTLDHGHGLRVAAVCVGSAVLLLATVQLIWQRARLAIRSFARVVCTGYAVLALVLLARALQALTIDAATKISIDAPGHSNIPLVILVMFVGGLINLAQIRLVLGRVLEQLTSQAHTDALTGALNRRGLLKRLHALHARADDASHAYALMMVDVDHFKRINDVHGHAVGDQVLQRVAQGLRDGLRAGDVVGRWGGEEFCVLLPRTHLPEAQALADALVRTIGSAGTPRVTISIGVAEVRAKVEPSEELIRRADVALYESKESGRNRVTASRPVPLDPNPGPFSARG